MSVAELRQLVPKIITRVDDGNFTEALRLLETNNKIASKLVTLRAYIYYRLNNYKRALELCLGLHPTYQQGIGVMHLIAQIQHKLAIQTGDYVEASRCYENLATQHPDACYTNFEYISNAIAMHINASRLQIAQNVLDHIDFETKVESNTPNELVTYETLFNASFLYHELGHNVKAQQYSTKALELFRQIDDDDDISEETLLQLQQSYLLLPQQQQQQQKQQQGQVSTTTDFSSLVNNTIPSKVTSAVGQLIEINTTIQNIQNSISHNNQHNATTTSNNNNNNKDSLQHQMKVLTTLQSSYQTKASKAQIALLEYNLAICSTITRQPDAVRTHLQSIPIVKNSHNVVIATTTTTTTTNAATATTTTPETIKLNEIDIIAPYSSTYLHKQWLQTTLTVYMLLKDKQYTQSIAELDRYIIQVTSLVTQHPSYTIHLLHVLLSRVYIDLFHHDFILAQQHFSAFLTNPSVCQLFPQIAYFPQSIALQLVILQHQQDFTTCGQLLSQALQYYNALPDAQTNITIITIVHNIHIQSATLKQKAGDYRGALDSLILLAEESKIKTKMSLYYSYIAQIVALCQTHFPENVTQYAQLLPDLFQEEEDNATSSSSAAFDAISTLLTQQLQTTSTSSSSSSTTTTTTAPLQFLPNGKRKFSPEKLARVRALKQQHRKPVLPRNITMEQYLVAKAAGFPGVDQNRWKPSWEREQIAAAKNGGKKNGKANNSALSKGPQGSGVAEHNVESTVKVIDKKAAAQEAARKNAQNKKKGSKNRGK